MTKKIFYKIVEYFQYSTLIIALCAAAYVLTGVEISGLTITCDKSLLLVITALYTLLMIAVGNIISLKKDIEERDIKLSSINGELNQNYKAIDLNVKIIKDSLSTRAYEGELKSKDQTKAMLEDARKLIEQGKRVNILECHLQPKPSEGVLDYHKSFLEFAAQKKAVMNWHIIIGQENNSKEEWITKLRDDLESNYKDYYKISILKDSKPSLNVFIVEELNEVYFGLGKWLGKDVTGGVWIKNEHIGTAMQLMFKQLETYCNFT